MLTDPYSTLDCVMRRLLFDSLALLLLAVGGVVLYAASISPAAPLNVFSGFENLIWTAVVSLIAAARAKAEASWLHRPLAWYLGLFEWCFVAASANLALFLLNVLIHPDDNFKTTFGFGLMIFFVPSVALSGIVYSLARLLVGKLKK